VHRSVDRTKESSVRKRGEKNWRKKKPKFVGRLMKGE
jgi:hypothetical protein